MSSGQRIRTPQPLAGASGGKTVRPCPRGEDVGNVDPWKRSPTHRVEADVDVEHCSHRLRCGRGSFTLSESTGWVSLQDGADAKGRKTMRMWWSLWDQLHVHEEEDAHSHCGGEQGWLTAEPIGKKEDEDGGGGEFNNTVDTRGKKCARRAAVSDLPIGKRYQYSIKTRGRGQLRGNSQRRKSGERSS